MAKPLSLLRERGKHYICSSHLGLIRCLNAFRVSATIHTQTICDKLGNSMHVTLPHELDHCQCMLSKQPRIPTSTDHPHCVSAQAYLSVQTMRCPAGTLLISRLPQCRSLCSNCTASSATASASTVCVRKRYRRQSGQTLQDVGTDGTAAVAAGYDNGA